MPGLQKRSSSTASFTKQSSTLSRQSTVTRQRSVTKQVSLTRAATVTSTATLIKASSLSKSASVSKAASLVKKKSLSKRASSNGSLKASMGKGARVKKAAKRFEFDEPETPPKKKAKTGKENKAGKEPERELLFRKGEYLAIRNEDDGFYLCRTLQAIWDNTERVKIWWLEEVDGVDNQYMFGYSGKIPYIDYQDADAFIIHAHLKRIGKDVKSGQALYELSEKELKKVEKALTKAINREKGIVDDDDEEEEEDDEDDQTKAKKKSKKEKKSKKPAAKTKKPSLKKTGSKIVKKSAPKKKGKKLDEKKTKDKKGKKEKEQKAKKEVLTAEQRKNPNLRLKPNPNVKVWNENPMLSSTEKVPYVSASAYSKLVHRAVMLGDQKLLQKLVDDWKQVSSVTQAYSHDWPRDPVELAIERRDRKSVQTLVKEAFQRDPKKKPRVAATKSMIEQVGTGSYNYRSLGVRNIRKLAMSRGSKEGNNAFTKDLPDSADIDNYVIYAIERGVPKEFIDGMVLASGEGDETIMQDKIWIAVRHGHRKLAGQLVADRAKAEMNPFNNLHKEVLLNDKEDLKPFRSVSVRKKPWDNVGITPIHCAAINPNVKYLSKLLHELPEYSITDTRGARPVHYAAACEGTGPLEFLLKRGQDPEEVDNSGNTALMVACHTNRPHNVELLLKKAKEDAKGVKASEDDLEGEPVNRYGLGGIDRPIMKPQNSEHSYTPLHSACEGGYLAVVKILVEYGANLAMPLSASKDKKTPLMLAASAGHLDVVKYLISKGALVEEKDKLKKTSLIHAVQNGFAHVASYLLSLGADPNQADTSGNTPLHYAAGYGWYFCQKVLLAAGADANASNDWRTTPLGIAFLKGHIGLADMLLEQPGVDINFKDENGLTLVAMACSSSLGDAENSCLLEQLDYLITKKKADCTIKDVAGNTPLHLLAGNNIKLSYQWPGPHTTCPKAVDLSVKVAKLLLDNGCDATMKNEDGVTAVMNAITQGNGLLVKFLVEHGGGVSHVANTSNQNMFHLMAAQCMDFQVAPLLQTIAKSLSNDELKVMSAMVDHKGKTPLLVAAETYQNWTGKVSSAKVEEEEEEDSASDMDEDDEDDYDDDDSDFAERRRRAKAEAAAATTAAAAGEEDPEVERDEDEDDMDVDDEEMESEEEGGRTNQTRTSAGSEKGKMDAQDQQWRWGREFIKALITLCGADVNAVTQKRHYDVGDEIPREEKDQYAGVGKTSVVHMLCGVIHERPLTTANGKENDPCPALTMILKRKPLLDQKDIQGRTALVKCIQSKRVAQALKLINAGADVNLASENKDEDCKASPLILAAKADLQKVVVKLCKRKADVKAVDCQQKMTALHIAVQQRGPAQNPMPMLRALIKAKSDVNARDKKKRTPLHLAVNANTGGADVSSEVETFLIDLGADVFAQDIRGRLPLHYVFVKIGRHLDTTAIDPIELVMTLTIAMRGKMIDHPDMWGQTPLHRAAWHGAGVCCVHLLQKKALINAEDRDKNTPLGLAIKSGHESCTIMLIQHNANINGNIYYMPPSKEDKARQEAEEEEGMTQEDKEKRRRKKAKPAWFWKPWKRPDPEKETKIVPILQEVVELEWQGVTFMMLDLLPEMGMQYSMAVEAALNTIKFNLAMTLIRKAGSPEQLREVNKDSANLFHVLCYKAQCSFQLELQLRVAKMLHARGISLVAKDGHGCTPLHYACLQHNSTLVKFILLHCKELKVEEKDGFGRTPMAACFWNFKASPRMIEISKLLMKRGAKVDTLCDFPDTDMALFGSTSTATIGDDQYHRSQLVSKITPLMLAICRGDFDTAKVLIDHGASINARSSDRLTPLMFAVKQNNLHISRLLLNLDYDRIAAEKEEQEATKKKQRVPARGKRKAGFALAARLAKRAKRDNESEGEDEEEEAEEEIEQVPQEDVDLNFKKFPKKSNMDLKAADIQGWTVIHHVVCPMEHGSYDNVQLLKMLCDAGAPLEQQDLAGLTALDYALIRGAPKLAKAIQKLLGRKKDQWERPTFDNFEVKDGITWTTPTPDYKGDAERMLAKLQTAEEQKQDKHKAEPDAKLKLGDTGEVVIDEDQDLPYDVMLTKIDAKASGWGLYNFYKMQVVYQKGKELFILFNTWGRIGDEGQYQQTPYPRKEDCVKEFCKIFKSKTGNPWENYKTFENKPGKYRLVLAEKRRKKKKLQTFKFALESKVPSKLPTYMQDCMREVMDVTAMVKALTTHCRVDEELMPLGRIKKENLLKAKDLLQEIMVLVKSNEKRKEKLPIEDLEGYHAELTEISELTNEYYHLVPRAGYAFERLAPLDSEAAVAQEWKHVDMLLELEVASTMLTAAQHRVKEVNPLDYVYRSMGCQIEVAKEDDPAIQYLLKYIHNSNRGCTVQAVFKVSRPGEEKRLRSCNLENHRLLFHGSSTFNLISILSKGLLIAPHNAPGTGHAFGKGIYLADMFDKSAGYCYNYSLDAQHKFMLVCQVALGQQKHLYETTSIEKAPAGFDSCLAMSGRRPDSAFDVVLPSGATIPLGEPNMVPWPESLRESTGLWNWPFHRNEYIVYDESQVCLRYIVQFKF